MISTVAIVHYNTPALTEAAIRSLNKVTPGCRVVVWDNSDEHIFRAKFDNVEVIDNTDHQLLDFRRLLERFPTRQETRNDHGSVKHCYTVDYLWSLLPEGFVLLDSDVLLKKDISSFFTDADRYAWTGEIFVDRSKSSHWVPRVLPMLCYLNVPMCRKVGIRYCDQNRSWRLKPGGPETWYDTGASFLEDCNGAGLLGREVKISDYIEHFSGGSWKQLDLWHTAWLNEHKELWQ